MDRRHILSLIASAAMLPRMARAAPGRRRLRLVNAHTAETFDGLYRDDRGPIASAMADLSVFLRDFHAAASIPIDVGVIDFLAAVMDATDVQSATILSAYRTPETNALLARTTFGVAENSQHLYGRALDVYLGNKLEDAMVAARAMLRGGVGWYPHSGFLHLDTGPVRNWDLGESGLGSLLLPDAKHNRLKKTGTTIIADRSGQLLPRLDQSGRLSPGLADSGRPLPEMEVRGRLLRGSN